MNTTSSPAASPDVVTSLSGKGQAHSYVVPEVLEWHQRVLSEITGKTVLSVFARDCSLGIHAAKSGARFVVNVDHDELAIANAKDFVRQTTLPIRPRFVISDAFAAMRQLAGIGQNERVRGKRMPAFPKLEPRQFDLVAIDPPLHTKTPFGVVDLLGDYASVFKPALLCTTVGGTLVCTNRLPTLDRATWASQLERAAIKAGRPIKTIEWITSETDIAPCVVALHLH